MSRSLKRVMRHRNTQIAASPVAGTAYSFADMYDAHVDEVYRFVHRRCRDHSLSEDITQEAFMTAIHSTDDPGSISIGWLITVARNRLYDVLRRQTRYREKLRLLTAENPGSHDAELAERLRVESALSDMSVEYRLVLTLHYIDGLTVPALADHLGRSVKSIEGLVTRARRALRERLDEEAESVGRGANRG